jgi:hypothetical protein
VNHTSRAKGAVARVLSPHLHKSDLFELLTLEFARVLRKAEREAHNAAIYKAANLAGDAVTRLLDLEPRMWLVRQLLTLERKGRR